MKLSDAILSGKPFRVPELARIDKNNPEIWYQVHDDHHIHVIGPDEIVPWNEAIHSSWAGRTDWEVKDE